MDDPLFMLFVAIAAYVVISKIIAAAKGVASAGATGPGGPGVPAGHTRAGAGRRYGPKAVALPTRHEVREDAQVGLGQRGSAPLANLDVAGLGTSDDSSIAGDPERPRGILAPRAEGHTRSGPTAALRGGDVSSLRAAIVVSEVLGPPKALRRDEDR